MKYGFPDRGGEWVLFLFASISVIFIIDLFRSGSRDAVVLEFRNETTCLLTESNRNIPVREVEWNAAVGGLPGRESGAMKDSEQDSICTGVHVQIEPACSRWISPSSGETASRILNRIVDESRESWPASFEKIREGIDLDRAVIADLMATLRSASDSRVIRRLLEVLDGFTTGADLSILGEMLLAHDLPERQDAAIRLLAGLDLPEGDEVILQAMESSLLPYSVRLAAVEAFQCRWCVPVSLSRRVLPHLRDALESCRPEERARAAAALAEWAGEDEIILLVGFLADDTEGAGRITLLDRLSQPGAPCDPRLECQIRKIFEDESGSDCCREAAAMALSARGSIDDELFEFLQASGPGCR